MELGGSDPFIVLNDADVNLAAECAVKGRLLNCGQVCIASKRFIVDQAVYDKFVTRLTEILHKLKIGNPLLPETQLGPMAREDLRENL